MSRADAGAASQAEEIRQRYREMQAARAAFQRAQGSSFEREVQKEYHDAIFNLYAELRPRLKHREVAQEIWAEVELWPVSERLIDAIACPDCKAYEPAEKDELAFQSGDECPSCGRTTLEPRQVPKLDDNGEVMYEWEQGLKNLDKYRNRITKEKIEYSDALGDHEEIKTQRQLLDPAKLEVAADLFGEAMEILGLYRDASTDDSIDTDEIR